MIHPEFYQHVLLQSDDNFDHNSINTLESFRPVPHHPFHYVTHHVESPLLLPDPPAWVMHAKARHLAHLIEMQHKHRHHIHLVEQDVMIGALLVTGLVLFGVMHFSNGGKSL